MPTALSSIAPLSLRAIFSIEHWRSRRMRDSRECRDDRKIRSIRRRVYLTPRSCRSTATVRAMERPTVSIREPTLNMAQGIPSIRNEQRTR
jgi:hypothetical protein